MMRQIIVEYIGGPYDGATEKRSDVFLSSECEATLHTSAFVGGDDPRQRRLRLAHVYRAWPFLNDPTSGRVRMHHSGACIVTETRS